MSYKITPQTWTPDDYKDAYSFTVKLKWVARLCVWCLIKRGYPAVAMQDLNFTYIKNKEGENE
tara:strand:- start:628 stop:816 length:189 start_codon:yes stop_codon:yes gene_type:complete